MNILDPVIELASTVADNVAEAGDAITRAVHAAVSNTVNAVEKVTGIDLNGDGNIGENSTDLHDERQVAELTDVSKVIKSSDDWL